MNPLGIRPSREIFGRYTVESVLAESDGGCCTYAASDRWLQRGVALAVSPKEPAGPRKNAGRLVARMGAPHVVAVYDRRDMGGFELVVFERPAATIASADSGDVLWRQPSEVGDTITSLVGALADLRGAGVTMAGMHPGFIGIGSSSEIKVSPWALDPPPPGVTGPWTELALAAFIVERAALVARSDALARIADSVRGAASDYAVGDLIEALEGLGSEGRAVTEQLSIPQELVVPTRLC